MEQLPKSERIFCKDDSGQDLFFLDLVFTPELPWGLLFSSLSNVIFEYPEIVSLANSITEKMIDSKTRNDLIENLFIHVRKIPGIEYEYFDDEMLDKSGRYMDYYQSTLESLLADKEFPDYSFFSERKNNLFFNFAKRNFLHETTLLCADEKHFQELIFDKPDLQLEYVENYHPSAQYYYCCLNDESKTYDFYLMVVDCSLKLFFLRESP